MARPTSVNDALHQLDQADLDTDAGRRQAADAVAYLEAIDTARGLTDEVRDIAAEARAELDQLDGDWLSRASRGMSEWVTRNLGGEGLGNIVTDVGNAITGPFRSGDGDDAPQGGPGWRPAGPSDEPIGPPVNPLIERNIAQREQRQQIAGVRDSLTGPQQQAWQEFVDRLVASGIEQPEAEEMADQAAALGQFDDAIDEDPFVGVPQDHRFPIGPADPQLNYNLGGGQARQFARPRYRESDTQRPYSMSSGQIAALQRRLVEAGLLSGEYRNGWYDAPTQNAYAQLLAFANQRGQRETQALDRLQSQWQVQQEEQREEARAEAMASFQPDPATMLAPDEDALRQRARSTLLSMGRRHADIDEDEINTMVDVMSGAHKRRRDLEVEIQRRQHAAQVESQFGDEQVNPDFSDLDMTDVDPMAQFDEWFVSDDGFGGEIETRETSEQVAQAGRTFEQGLGQMRGAVRGGGA